MDRAYLFGASATPPAAPVSPSIGYPTGGVPGTTPPTEAGPYWFYMITESMRAVIVAAGLTPSQDNLSLFKQAMDLLYAPYVWGYWSYCNAAASGSSGVVNFQTSTVGAVGVSSYSSGTVTVTNAGVYRITGSVTAGYFGGISGATELIQVYRNGAPLATPVQNYWQESNNTTEVGTLFVETQLQLSAGDTVSIRYTASGGQVVSGNGSFTGLRIG